VAGDVDGRVSSELGGEDVLGELTDEFGARFFRFGRERREEEAEDGLLEDGFLLGPDDSLREQEGLGVSGKLAGGRKEQ
jgi:hypothetical protein